MDLNTQKTIMRIGILSKNYAAKRLFLNKINEAKYCDLRFNNVFFWKNLFLFLCLKLGFIKASPQKIVAKIFYNYKTIIPTKCSIYHFFNCISHDKKHPWVISVESAVPWTDTVSSIVESDSPDFSIIKEDKFIENRIKKLASPECLALLPLSKCSYNIQMELIKQFPQYYESIKNKTFVFSPPQQLMIKNIEEKGLTWDNCETFEFLFVGRDFFRKGGLACLEVLVELHKEYDFKLTLISTLAVDEKKYLHSTSDVQKTLRLISENRNWIEYHKELENDIVLRKLIKAHVCLLPTYMDTYAYSVLESQSCGTPLITTSLRALTDINDNNVGWTIKVPVNKLNNPLLNTQEQQDRFYETLKIGLKEKIIYVLNHRQEVKEKSKNCLNYIQKYHNQDEYIQKLHLIYSGRRMK